MRLDLTSFAFGFRIADSAGNPNWATSLGQGAEYKINEESTVNEVLKGLIYSSIPLSSVQTKIGKGGKLYRGDDSQAAIVLASEFRKVFVNGQRVKKCRLMLLLTRDTSRSHEGRLRLKYSPNNSRIDDRGAVVYSNAEELTAIRSALNISASACWFVYALDVINQDELHLSVGVASSNESSTYTSTEALHKHWQSLIPNLETKEVETGVAPSAPLDIALRYFKEHRDDFAMGEKVNEGIRAYFDPLTEEGLRNFTEEQFTDLFLGKEKYEHMWSGTNGKGWGHIKKAGREAAMNFIADLKAIPVSAEVFCDKSFDAPNGFGRVTIAELQMKFRPTEFCAYSKRTAAAFRILKLDEREFNGNFTAEDYNAILAITETIRAKMEEMGIGLTRKDASKPDYLSANEFVDFVLENETLILQEWGKQMKHEIDVGKQEPIAGSEGFKAFIEKFHEAADKAGLTYDLDLVRRFVCAMLAKKRPFVILTGLSGSGKTKLAEAFSKWMGVEHTHMLVSVGADWTNSEKLLGFPNALEPKQYVSPDTGVLQFLRDAEQNPDVPFFLILDEMNLSHVECYFADFLSAMESSDGVIRLYDGGEREDENGVALKPTITFPKNLFIIGTMNVDETTRASSPKVLDRAQVIEFRVSKGDLATFLDEPKELDLNSLDGQGKAYSKAFLDLHDNAPALDNDGTTTNRDEISAALKTLFEPLAELGAEFGYRTAGEAMRFCAYDLHAGAGVVPAIDAAVMQKLLPKLHGSQARLAPVLKKIADLSEEEYEVSEEGGEKKKAKRPKYPLTHEKVGRMMVRVKANGFTGFAEA